MTIAQTRRALAERFRAGGLDEAEADARVLLGHALGLDRAGLLAASDRRLGPQDILAIEESAARRLGHTPVAHIVGEREFWGLPLRVSEATLIPRPDTETLIEAALAFVDAQGERERPLRIADLCTGSGAILLALLSELPGAVGVATDIGRDALAVARANSVRLGLAARAHFVRCDFGAALAGGVDLVLSNPPYIPTADLEELAPEVRREPASALDGGADGLVCYRAIAADAQRLLAPGGALILELGIGQGPAVAALARANGLVAGPARPDLGGIPRALTAVWPKSRHAPVTA
jgi:release factor glutamine methyltransferase